MKNINIKWDVDLSKLYVEMVFPYVAPIRMKNGKEKSSYKIVDKSAIKILNDINIDWKNLIYNEYQILRLSINIDNKDEESKLSLGYVNYKIKLLHDTITTKIDKLINRRD